MKIVSIFLITVALIAGMVGTAKVKASSTIYTTSEMPASAFHMRIAADSDGGIHLVWIEYPASNNVSHYDIMYGTKPSGGSWSSKENISNDPYSSCCPALACDSVGGVHVVWECTIPVSSDYSNVEVYYATKPKGGSWSTAANLSNTPSVDGSGGSFYPAIAIDSNDNLHVAWKENNTAAELGSLGMGIRYITKPSGGTWSSTGNVSDHVGHLADIDIATDNVTASGGGVHIVWTQGAISPGGDLVCSEKLEGGSWSTPVNISNTDCGSYLPDIAVDSAASLHLVWLEDNVWDEQAQDWLNVNQIRYATKGSGGSWSPPIAISDNSAYLDEPAITVDADGTLHVVWRTLQDSIWQIFYTSKSQGQPWTTPVNISDSSRNCVSVDIACASVHPVWGEDTGTNVAIMSASPLSPPPLACFIATAAYGTPMAEEIQILREFRDRYLLTNSLGQVFVVVYYRISPPIAEFITEHPSLKPIVRIGLLPAVAMSAVAVNATPAEKMAMLGLLALVSVTLAVWVMRRRCRGPEYS